MPEYATARTDYSGLSPEARYTQQLRTDPNFQVPAGYHALSNGVVIKDPGWMQRNFVNSGRGTLGLMAGLTGTGFLPGGAFAGGAGAAAGVPSLGVTSGLPTAATVGGGAGGAAAAAGGFGMNARTGMQLGSLAMPLLGMLSNRGGNETPQNAALERLLSQQSARMDQSAPLYQAILKMAMGILPVSARAGLTPPGGRV